MDLFLTLVFVFVLLSFMILAVLKHMNLISVEFLIFTLSIIIINTIFVTNESFDVLGKIAVTITCLTIYSLTLFYLFRKKVKDEESYPQLPDMVGKRLIAINTISSFIEGDAKFEGKSWRCITVDGSVVIGKETVEVVEQDASLLKVRRIKN